MKVKMKSARNSLPWGEVLVWCFLHRKKQQQKHMSIIANCNEIVNFPVYNIYIYAVSYNQNRANNWTDTVLNEILPYNYIVTITVSL